MQQQQIFSDMAGEVLSGASEHLAKTVLATLQKHYPVFSNGWRVTINQSGGAVQVTNELLSGRMGFVLHTMQIDPEMKSVMRAGGELLERYRMARSKVVNIDHVLQNVRDSKRDMAGNMVAER